MNTIKKNFLYNSLYQILILAVPIITTPYLTRTIGADGVGIYSYNYSITNYFMMFVLLGLENYGNREIAKNKNDKNKLSYTFSSIYLLQLFMGILVIISYSIFIFLSGQNSFYALIFGINIIATCLDINWALYGLELFKSVALRNTLIKVITTILIFSLVKNKNDVSIYCLIMLLCNLLSQVCAWPILLKKTYLQRPKIRDIFRHLKPNLWLFLTVLSVGIYKSTDKIMLGIFDPQKTQVGFYELSERIISIPNILVISLGTVMMPRITYMISNNESKYIDTILPSMFFSLFISTSMCFGIMGISKEFVPLFYGEGFELCISLFLILTPCSLFMSFASVIRTQYILPNSMDKTLVKAGVYGNILNICINLMLIPTFNAIGAAIATLTAEMFGCLYQTLSVRNELPIKQYVRFTLPLLCIGFLMFLTIFNFDFSLITNSLLISMMIKIVIGIVIYISGFLIYLFLLNRQNSKESKQIIDFFMQYIPRFSQRK